MTESSTITVRTGIQNFHLTFENEIKEVQVALKSKDHKHHCGGSRPKNELKYTVTPHTVDIIVHVGTEYAEILWTVTT